METRPLQALGPRVDVHARAWPSGVRSTTFDHFVDEIMFLIDAVGIEHVAIGTDMDGNYRPVMTRHDQFDELQNSLAARGLTDKGINRVLGGNAIELVRTVCG